MDNQNSVELMKDNEAEVTAKMNPIQRIIGVIFSPVKTMEDISNKPNFMVPLIITVLVTLLYGLVTYKATYDFALESFEKQMATLEDKGTEVTEEMKETQKSVLKITSKATLVLLPTMAIIGILIMAAVSLLVLKIILQGKGTFKGYFSALSYIGIIGVLGFLVKIAVYLITNDYQSSLYVTSLKGVFPTKNNTLSALLTNIDVFNIWTYILYGIGFKAVSKLSKEKVAVYVGGIFVLLTGLTVISAALTDMFS